MALNIGGVAVPDQNLGKVTTTIIQTTKTLQGSIKCDGIVRLDRSRYEKGEGLLACLQLEDKYFKAVLQDGSQTYQEALGYPASNFIDPNSIVFV
jgi:hypothetical protein